MRDCRLLIGAFICIGVLLCSSVHAQGRITLKAELTEPTDGLANVIVSFEIEEGWHAYAKNENGQVLEVTLELPDDVVAAGRWEKPESVAYDEFLIYEGEGTFSRKLSVEASDVQRQIVATVAYQICNETGCMAPDEVPFILKIPASTPAPAKQKQAGLQFDNKHFAAPELIIADGERLNTKANQMYISPTVYDIDNDGALELVTGDVAGKIRVYENKNDDKEGQPVWTDAGFLPTTEGENVIAANW